MQIIVDYFLLVMIKKTLSNELKGINYGRVGWRSVA